MDGALDRGQPVGPEAGRDLTAGDAVAHDARAATDLVPPDLVVVPDASPCIHDDFNTSLAASKVTIQRGDWVWKAPGSLRQQKLDYFGGQALVQGSETMVGSFAAESTVTVDQVYDNGKGQGGGLSLVVRQVSSNEPHRQVMCLTWIWANTGVNKLALASFPGTSKSASSLASQSLGFSVVGVPASYALKVEQQGSSWTATCTLTAGANTESVTADVTSIVDAQPLGVALFTTGVTADFDWVEVCPGP